MKLSAYHKSLGDDVEMWSADAQRYDIVYASKVFTFSKMPEIHNAEKLICGGSGFDLTNRLPDEVEHQYPDYSLYPQYDFALGFLTRGCPRRNHSFCITPQKDGCRSVKVADLSEFWGGQKDICLLDQNILACRDRDDLLCQLADSGANVEFCGGLDARFFNEHILALIKKIKRGGHKHHLAWDDPREDMFPKLKLWADMHITPEKQTYCYVLTNYWSTIEQDLERIYKIKSLGIMPFVMIYDKGEFFWGKARLRPDVWERFSEEQIYHACVCRQMQRWCNNPFIAGKNIPFDEYERYITMKRRWESRTEEFSRRKDDRQISLF